MLKLLDEKILGLVKTADWSCQHENTPSVDRER